MIIQIYSRQLLQIRYYVMWPTMCFYIKEVLRKGKMLIVEVNFYYKFDNEILGW